MKTQTSATSPDASGPLRPGHTHPPARGFTLVELLVVFAILALLVGVVPFAFDKLQAAVQYRSTVRQIMTDLRATRGLAVQRGMDAVFAVDVAQKTYGLAGAVAHPVPAPLEIRVIAASQEFQGQHTAGIRFLSGGGSSGGTLELVRPTGQGGTRIVVDWLTGRISQELLTP